jgi:hypothetical protein
MPGSLFPPPPRLYVCTKCLQCVHLCGGYKAQSKARCTRIRDNIASLQYSCNANPYNMGIDGHFRVRYTPHTPIFKKNPQKEGAKAMKNSRKPPLAPRTNPANVFTTPMQFAGAHRTRSQPPCKLQGHIEHVHDPHANCRDTVNTFTTPTQLAGAHRTQMLPPRNLQGCREQAHDPHTTPQQRRTRD